MIHTLSAVAPANSRRAFTLIELLVVIGIIAVLVGILLPVLASARRSANSVKCLAALKEIGNALKVYAIDYKGTWPVSSYRLPAGLNVQWMAWPDMISQYVTKNKNIQRTTLTQLRRSSVLWGCPEWTKSWDWDNTQSNISGEMVYTGYGMSQYTPTSLQTGSVNDRAIFTASVNPGRWEKYTVWGKRGAERLLICDSTIEYLQVPPTIKLSGPVGTIVEFQPYDVWATSAVGFGVDGARHAKTGTPKKAVLGGMKSFNGLFCDGHASPVSIAEAWNAIRNPGQNNVTP
jgi:prepilin-type N-terminal cleavage/methylation domain-containing protein/prepilin-type processing-associated H-X9-DG protein